MADALPVAEFRRSLSLMRSETWVLTGGLVGALGYALWVLATGIATGSTAPWLANRGVTSVGGVTVTGLSVVALVLWVLIPAAVVTPIVARRFVNEHGNLDNRYRLDHPTLLLAPPGLVLVGSLAVTVTTGRSAALTAIALVASVHLLVRAVAYGYRVYTLSVPRLFTVLLGAGSAALAGSALVAGTLLTGLSTTAAGPIARAGVPTVVETGLALAGVAPGDALAGLVTVPALLATTYLAVQYVAGTVVRTRAPLANPTRRPGQRFPIMPPVGQGDSGENDDGTPEGDAAPADDASAPADAEAEIEESVDDHSQTQVFTPDDPTSGADDAPTEAATVDGMAADDNGTDDEWEDDTAVFSFDRGSPSPDACDACGETVAADADVSFCPNCGDRLD